MMEKAGFKSLILAALSCLAVASCATIEDIPLEELQQAQAVEHLVFQASFDDALLTRTALTEDFDITWSEGEEITVFSGTTAYTFTATAVSDDGLVATFEGDAATASTYYAIYPKDASATITADGVITTTLKSEQTATAASFATATNLCVAQSSRKSFEFKNVGAIVAVTVNNDDIASVELSSDTVLSGGTAQISLSGGAPTATVTGGSCKVKLSGGLTNGSKHYFVVYPGTHSNGFTLTFADADGNRAIYKNSKSCEIVANGNIYLGAITIADSKWIGPAVSFLDSVTYGIYDADLSLVDYAFNKYTDQIASVVDTKNSFRIQNLSVSDVKYVEVYGLPSTYTVGDSFEVRVLQNYVTSLGENYPETVTVEKVENGLVWLKAASGKGYIVKQ